MICPKCHTSLSPMRVAEGSLWKCEGCSGVAANVAVLRKYLKDDTVRRLWLEAIAGSTLSNRKCPCCVQMLKEFTVSRDNRRIHLDLCRTCQLIWFDKNELEAFPRAEKLHSPNMDENLALAKIGLEAELENEQSSAENIIAQGMDILFLIIRLFW
ncbi:MAG: zf-TFIIB domain-containing protein [Sedimentisphaerales bacterium]